MAGKRRKLPKKLAFLLCAVTLVAVVIIGWVLWPRPKQDVPSAAVSQSSFIHPTADQIVTPNGAAPMVKDQLLIGVALNVTDPDSVIKKVATQTKGTVIGSSLESHIYQVQYKGVSIDELDKKRKDAEWVIGVSFAAFNVQATAETNTPEDPGYNDPAFPKDDPWNDTSSNPRNWGQRYIGLPEAWSKTTGSKSVRIGVVDIGFDFTHPDLKNNIINPQATSLHNEKIAAKKPHGTHVAGIACADGNNGKGIAGVMWQCGLGLYDSYGGKDGDDLFTSDIADALQTAAKNNSRVVNLSYGWMSNKDMCGKEISYLGKIQVDGANKAIGEIIEWAKTNNKDVLWVFAAGNSCHPASEVAPAALVSKYPDNVITVGSIAETENMSPANIAALLVTSNSGDDVSVAAPGERIYTTTAQQAVKAGEQPYTLSSGTSIAAPFVTGLAGLVWSEHSDLTAQRVKQCIVQAANASGHSVEGQKFKVINAPAAIDCGAQPDPNKPHTVNDRCVFSFATLPEQCSSTNPTVEVKFTNVAGSDQCDFESHIGWDANSKKVDQTDLLNGIRVGGIVSLATHTFSGYGTHPISHTVSTHTGGPCTILDSLYEFTLVPKGM